MVLVAAVVGICAFDAGTRFCCDGLAFVFLVVVIAVLFEIVVAVLVGTVVGLWLLVCVVVLVCGGYWCCPGFVGASYPQLFAVGGNNNQLTSQATHQAAET